MADTRKITIEIVQVDGSSNNPNPTPTPNGNVEKKPTNDVKLLGKSVLLNQAFNVAKSQIINTVERSITRNLSLTENYLGENIYNATMTTINKVTSAGTSIIGGAVAGFTVGGGVGALIGGAISAVGTGVSEYISYQSRMSNYYQSVNTMNYGASFGRTRAGLVNEGRGTEN